MTRVLNGTVKPGDFVAYSVRKHWSMATRIGVVIAATSDEISGEGDLLVRVVKSSDAIGSPKHLVWLTELDRVVKVNGMGS